jgi:ASC-1-like (ASCH) protein
MATYETTTHPLAFAHMEGGMKTVYVLPWTMELSMLSAGDRIEFEGLGSIAIGMKRRYPTLERLLEAEGYENVVPEAASAEDAMGRLRQADLWNQAAAEKHGIYAFRVRSAKRKA